ncbi:MAG: alpha/beta hydrolase [Novosphingobium sp.]|nr:alpha/beta hydrolase [Novosphingobium sp.]
MRAGLAFVLPLAALLAAPAAAQVADGAYAGGAVAERFVHAPPAPIPAGIAAYGPFRVIDPARAALVDVTDERTPAQFAAMLRDYPGLAMLEMVDCPGTYDDRANLRLGRMIRAAGIATYVPSGGSVRSGGVELFLAGAERLVDDGAEFAVHAWSDEDGLEASDYAVTAPENHKYLIYYREMGMDGPAAQAFYAMTNSVPFGGARWFGAAEMRRWLGQETASPPPQPAPASAPKLAYLALPYLDLGAGLH